MIYKCCLDCTNRSKALRQGHLARVRLGHHNATAAGRHGDNELEEEEGGGGGPLYNTLHHHKQKATTTTTKQRQQPSKLLLLVCLNSRVLGGEKWVWR